MKFLRTAGLTLFFFIGILTPSCDWITDDDDCNCNGSRYFDVMDLELRTYVDEQQGVVVEENQTLFLQQFGGFYLDYVVDYHAMQQQKSNESFNLLGTLNACSCLVGFDGSKSEALDAFTVTTVNDFDDEHLAGSSINDLLTYRGSFFEVDNRSLEDFLAEESQGNLLYEDIRLTVDKAPTLDSVFQVQMKLELSTGENYEVISTPFVLLPG